MRTMTDKEFRSKVGRLLALFERQARHSELEDVRMRFREEHGVIYVREYTVKAHMRIRRFGRHGRH